MLTGSNKCIILKSGWLNVFSGRTKFNRLPGYQTYTNEVMYPQIKTKILN